MKRGYRRLTLGFTLLLIGSVVFSSGAAVIAETTIEPQETGQLRKAPEETLPDAPRTYANTYETSDVTSEEVDKSEESKPQTAQTVKETQPTETPSTQEPEAEQAEEQPTEKTKEQPEEEKQEIQQQSLETGDFSVEGGTLDQEYTYADHVLTFQSNGNFSVSGTTKDDRIVIAAAGVVLTLNGVKIDVSANDDQAALLIESNATATIDLVGENELTSGENCAGLQNDNSVADSLVITSSAGSIEGYAGNLLATGGNYGSGIGGDVSGNGTVTVNGGAITANGRDYGSGIGGGYGGNGTVIVNGGTVTSIGNGGSGIGGGRLGNGIVTVNGGTVTASGGAGSGIGGGYRRSGTVTVNGGTVTATGGLDSSGIGDGGGSSTSGKVTITNGTVKALDQSGVIDSITPRPVNDKDANVALCNLIPAQPNENVTIDGVDAKIAGPHEGDSNYYFYLTKEAHKITVDNNGQQNHYLVLWNEEEGKFYFWESELVVDDFTDVTYSNNELVLGGDNQTYTVTMREGITETTVDRIKVTGESVTVKLNNVKINVSANVNQAALLIASNATATIDLMGENELKSGNYCAGLQNDNETKDSLVITSSTGSIEGCAGSLVANGGGEGSGIGGGSSGAGMVTINEGVITANGGGEGSGIGGGSSGAGMVTINGGTVKAQGGEVGGSGIGGGSWGAGTVTINGGIVTASGASAASGIGGGLSKNGTVTLNGGTVTATGVYYGSGIGGGPSGAGMVTISGGTVTATGGEGSSGIGDGGGSSTTGKVTITNGTVKALDHSGEIDSITPRPVNDKDANVALCNLISAQPNENVTIDGVDAKIAGLHEGDSNYYFYLTKEAHKITVDNNGQQNHYLVLWNEEEGKFYFWESELVVDDFTDVTYSNNELILGGDNQT